MSFIIEVFNKDSDYTPDGFEYSNDFIKAGQFTTPTIKWRDHNKPDVYDVEQGEGTLYLLKSKIIAFKITADSRLKINGENYAVNYMESSTGVLFNVNVVKSHEALTEDEVKVVSYG